MPFVQCDLEVGLSDAKKTALVRKMTEITHKAIESAYGHINVVLREHPASNIGEAGGQVAPWSPNEMPNHGLLLKARSRSIRPSFGGSVRQPVRRNLAHNRSSFNRTAWTKRQAARS
jgi:phenylpyruvate tautomerase PptA (4-oxalocrotonate tautomerase family)